MKILILGSKGYIGSSLFSYFRYKNYTVYGADIFENELDEKYFQFSSNDPNFDLIFASNAFEICINCTGASNVLNSFNDQKIDFKLNTMNVFDLLNSIKLFNPTCKFINLSSAAVYGNPSKMPIKEHHQLSPISPYGFHKMISENILLEFSKIYGIQTCSLRIFSVYGVGLKKQLLWDIFNKWKNNKVLEFNGTGNETRDFIYIDDLLKVIEIIIAKGKFNGEVLNVANGEEIKVYDIVKYMINELGNREFTFNKIFRNGDPLRWKADVSKIEEMGYLKSVKIEDGIRKYVKWLKDLK